MEPLTRVPAPKTAARGLERMEKKMIHRFPKTKRIGVRGYATVL